MKRRLVAALLVVLLAFSLAGCGGSEEAPAAPDDTAVPPPVEAVPVEAAEPDRSNVETEVFEPFPPGDFVPVEVAKRLDKKPIQPMLLFFFGQKSLETDNLKAAIDEVMDENRGAIDLIAFDLGQYTSVNDKGEVTVKDAKLADDETAKRAAMLARELEVRYTPSIVLVDEQGYIIFKWRGFLDAEMLGRQVDRTKK